MFYTIIIGEYILRQSSFYQHRMLFVTKNTIDEKMKTRFSPIAFAASKSKLIYRSDFSFYFFRLS